MERKGIYSIYSVKLQTKIHRIAQINADAGVPQELYVMEEASEFIKAYTKLQRHKDMQEHMLEEAIDMVSALSVLFDKYQIPRSQVIEQVDAKVTRAIERYKESQEV